MRLYKFFLLSLSLFLTISCAANMADTRGNILSSEVKSVELKKVDENRYNILVEGDEGLNFQIYYSKSPYKISIFASDAMLSSEVMKYKYNDDLIEKVVSFIDNQGGVIEVYFKEDIEYKVNEKLGKLDVEISKVSRDIKALGRSGLDFKAADFEDINVAKNVYEIKNFSDNNQLLLKIKLDGVVRYDYGYIDDNLLYIDLFDVQNKISAKRLSGYGLVKDIRVGSYYPPQKVRFLVNMKYSLPIFAGQNGSYLIVSNEVNNVPQDVKYLVDVESISVKKYQSIIVKTIGRPVYTKKVVDGNLVLEFSEDVKALSTVKNIMSFENLPFKRVRIGNVDSKLSIVIVPNGEIYAKVEKTPEGIMISGSFDEFSRAEEKLVPVLDDVKKGENAVYKYDKRDLVTLSLRDMDVREAIRLIYYGRNKNIVFGSEVKGTVSLYVKDVPYRKALDVIYNENQLVELEEDNIVWIITKAKKDELEANKIKEAKQTEQQKELEPLITEIVPVNYTAASDYKGVIESVLSKRGKLQIEARTNSFVITDTKENIEKAKDLLSNIDIPTPQVTIEARIVEVFDVNDVNIGIQWGGKYSNTFNTSHSFPNTVDVIGNTGATSPISGNNYLVNLPIGNPAGALAFSLGSISGKYALDVALSALEEENKAKTISSPRVTTLDNQEAEIKSGGTALIVPSGDNTQAEEIDVGIKLKVKPHITANKMVYMEIEVEKSSLGQVTANTATTEEKKAKTQVLLASGETTVIGGIYEDEKRNITTGIPGLSKIPFFGWLFKSRNTITTKRELLVFLTPQVVGQD